MASIGSVVHGSQIEWSRLSKGMTQNSEIKIWEQGNNWCVGSRVPVAEEDMAQVSEWPWRQQFTDEQG